MYFLAREKNIGMDSNEETGHLETPDAFFQAPETIRLLQKRKLVRKNSFRLHIM